MMRKRRNNARARIATATQGFIVFLLMRVKKCGLVRVLGDIL
jgi:hypothetical protein